MYWFMLYYIILYYIILYYIILDYIILYYIILYYIVLYYITLYYITLYYITLYYIMYIPWYPHEFPPSDASVLKDAERWLASLTLWSRQLDCHHVLGAWRWSRELALMYHTVSIKRTDNIMIFNICIECILYYIYIYLLYIECIYSVYYI